MLNKTPVFDLKVVPNVAVPRVPDRVIQYGLALLTLTLVAAPLLPILYQSFLDRPLYDSDPQETLRNYRLLLTDPKLRSVLGNTLVYGIVSTLIAQAIGVVAAVLVARTDMPGRSLLGGIFMWPLFLSNMVLGLGWIIAYGPSGIVTLWLRNNAGIDAWNLYSMAGLCLVTAVAHAPLTFLYCVTSARLQDSTLEDAARVSGAGPLRIFFRISLPLLMPSILFSGTMNFVITIESLALPLILGTPVGLDFFTTELYQRGFQETTRDYGVVAAGAVALLVIVSLLLLFQNRILRGSSRYVTVGGKAARSKPLGLGRFRWPATIGLTLYLVIALTPVVVGVTLRAFTSILSPFVPLADALTLENFRNIFSTEAYIRTLANTLTIAVVGGIIGTVFISLLTLLIRRSQFRWRKQLEYVALFPRAIPGIIVGVGAFYAVALLPFLGPLRNTIWILVVVYIMRYIPSGYSVIAPMTLQISDDLDRGARTVGASWWTTSTRILAPLIKPAAISCFCILFIQFVKEYAAALFLFSKGSEVLGATMLIFWVQGDVGTVSALATIQVAIIAVFVTMARRLLGVKIYG